MTHPDTRLRPVAYDPDALAQHLFAASRTGRLVSQLSGELDGLTLEQGYEIQRCLRELHLAEGVRLVGWKLGLTSRAKQAQMGVDSVVHGFLTDAMRLDAGEPLVVGSLRQARGEPEIAFLMGRDLSGPRASATDVLAATEAVCPAIEVLDSRYPDYRFTLADVVADNTSGARFVLGPATTPPAGLDLRLVGCTFERNGELMATAAGAAALGHPAASVAALVRALDARGESIRAGDVILSGGLTAAVPLVAGDVITVQFDRLGTVELACL